MLGGKVIKNDTQLKRIRVAYNESGDETGLITTSTTAVQIWDESSQTLTPATLESVLPGDKIYAKMRYLSCNEIIIIRE